MRRSLIGCLVSTYRNIRKVLSYVPVLWNNYDWDYEYLYEIECKKLKDMIKYMTDHQFSDGDERSVRYMKICVSLLEEMMGNVDSSNRYVNLKNFRITNERFGEFTRNAHERQYNERFDPDITLDVRNEDGTKSDLFDGHVINRFKIFKEDVRKEKVYRLYFKIRYYLTDNWWN